MELIPLTWVVSPSSSTTLSAPSRSCKLGHRGRQSPMSSCAPHHHGASKQAAHEAEPHGAQMSPWLQHGKLIRWEAFVPWMEDITAFISLKLRVVVEAKWQLIVWTAESSDYSPSTHVPRETALLPLSGFGRNQQRALQEPLSDVGLIVMHHSDFFGGVSLTFSL